MFNLLGPFENEVYLTALSHQEAFPPQRLNIEEVLEGQVKSREPDRL